ncbi:unnamed protein product [Prorocentrum cordatum]|uniref:Mannosyltransferase n=1 Tax=Prorocentrum cordatum TaxID=2364126 RepID=A0ABN9Q3A2_9DINO|nr:unnamed protein product [Polarella glacialis]
MPCKRKFFTSCAGSFVVVYGVLNLYLGGTSFQEEEALPSAGSSGLMPPGNGTFRTLDVKRIAWLHPPKVGSSFVNTLFGYACPGMKNDEYITRKMYDVIVLFKIKKIPDEWQCPLLEDGSSALDLHCSHKAITWQNGSPCNYWKWSKDNFIQTGL